MRSDIKMSEKKFDWINSLKGIAICGVVMTHTIREGLPDWLENIAAFGANGVQLFFVISGFLLFTSYETSVNKEGCKRWYLRRFIRLVPLYWIYLILSLVIEGTGPRYWLGTLPKISIANIVSNFLFLNGWNPYWINSFGITWYIADLTIFILLIPLLYKLIKTKFSAISVLLVSILFVPLIIHRLQGITVITDAYLWADFLYICFLNQLPVLLFGICCKYIVDDKNADNKQNDFTVFCYILIIFAIFLLERICNNRVEAYGIPYIYYIAFMCAIILCCGFKVQLKFINNKILGILGKYSYGIYFSHYLLRKTISNIEIVQSSIIEFLIRFILCLGIALIISIIVTNLIEKPIISYYKKVFNNLI